MENEDVEKTVKKNSDFFDNKAKEATYYQAKKNAKKVVRMLKKSFRR